jgi:hypothetical protein
MRDEVGPCRDRDFDGGITVPSVSAAHKRRRGLGGVVSGVHDSHVSVAARDHRGDGRVPGTWRVPGKARDLVARVADAAGGGLCPERRL